MEMMWAVSFLFLYSLLFGMSLRLPKRIFHTTQLYAVGSCSEPTNTRKSLVSDINAGFVHSAAAVAGGVLLKADSANAEDGPSNPTVFFDINIGDESAGRVTFELFADQVPKTAENFRSLCAGDKGLSFKGSPFHRIIPNFMCQGGDITRGDGRGGVSIYGGKFNDENFNLKHDKQGKLSMANAGPNTNGSQFFVTLVPCPWLDGRHVVFGEVRSGFDVIKKCEAVGSESGRTKRSVKVANCGQLS